MARAIDGTKATKEVMEYSRKLHEAGNVDAAGYVMWAASIVDKQPTIDPVKQFANELINRLNNNASRYVGGICNGRFYPETELFDVDEVYEIIDRVLDGVPEDEGARMDGGAEDGKSD